MTLELSYLVYGEVTLDAFAVNNASVYATGTEGTIKTTTDNNGRYILDLKTVADSDGDTITVRANYSGHNTSTSFTLDISGLAEEKDIALT